MTTNRELEDEWEQIVKELVGWNYGTVYKGYDNEELAACLEEDTREYINKLKELTTEERQKLHQALLSGLVVFEDLPEEVAYVPVELINKVFNGE